MEKIEYGYLLIGTLGIRTLIPVKLPMELAVKIANGFFETFNSIVTPEPGNECNYDDPSTTSLVAWTEEECEEWKSEVED